MCFELRHVCNAVLLKEGGLGVLWVALGACLLPRSSSSLSALPCRLQPVLCPTWLQLSQTSAKGKDGTCNAKSKLARVKLETWCTCGKGSQGCGCPFCRLPTMPYTCASGRGTGIGSAGARRSGRRWDGVRALQNEVRVKR